jgi:hypothetical protein
MLGQRESGTARLEEAVRAFDACLTEALSAWPSEWVEDTQARREAVLNEIDRRRHA